MFAWFVAAFAVVLILMSDLSPFVENSYIGNSAGASSPVGLALEALLRRQARAERAAPPAGCGPVGVAGCVDGPIVLAPPPSTGGAAPGLFGSVRDNGVVLSWYSPTDPALAVALLSPGLVDNVPAETVIGRYNAATGFVTGLSSLRMALGPGVPTPTAPVPPMLLPISAAAGVPDGAIVIASHR